MLDSRQIANRLSTVRYGRSLKVVASTQSTNDDAQQAAAAGAATGHVVIADSQRAGRGSHGRQWSSPVGTDLYLSVVDRPAVPLHHLPPLTLAVGLGVADTVCELLPGLADRVAVKWPNDLWIGDKKCAGVLVETSSVGDQLQDLVIGIGLNVNRARFSGPLDHPASSLYLESGRLLDREHVAACLLRHVESRVDEFCLQGPARIVEALNGRLALQGRQVRVGDHVGQLTGVSPSGGLQLLTDSGSVTATSGRLKEFLHD